MTDANQDEATKRLRSPPYPTTSLAKAVDRARALYNKALHHQVLVSVLADAWGYGAKSSGLAASAATLGQFGLIKAEGGGPKRRYQLTDIAMRIIRDADPESVKRREALKRAALTPPVFQELWETFGRADGVSDVVIRNFLTLDRHEAGRAPFSDMAALDILQTYKDTLAYAGITDADAVPAPEEEKVADDERSIPSLKAETGIFGIKTHGQEPIQPSRSGIKLEAERINARISDSERELVAGLLSKESSFRLIVTGYVGVKEIERLIRKLEIDKEILADFEKEDGHDLT